MSSPSLSPPITTPSSKRIAAVINHHHPHTPPPLTLIGANIRPDHNLSSSSSASSLASSLSAIPITSGPPLSSSSASTDSHHLDLPRSHSKDLLTVAAEADDVFLPLQSSADFTFPINSSDASGSQRAQHARRHSRVHSRNLSVFFPRPGQHSTLPVSPHTPTQVVEIPPAKVTSESSHLAHTPTSATTSADLNTPASSRAKGRRGHHHRHSLSHKYVLSLTSVIARSTSLSPTQLTRSSAFSLSSTSLALPLPTAIPPRLPVRPVPPRRPQRFPKPCPLLYASMAIFPQQGRRMTEGVVNPSFPLVLSLFASPWPSPQVYWAPDSGSRDS